MHTIPWRIFNLMTSAVWLCWMIAFVWSIADAVTSHDLGKPHPSTLTAEWNETYNPDVVGWPERRLAPKSSDSANKVSSWLKHLGYAEASEKAAAFGVDG